MNLKFDIQEKKQVDVLKKCLSLVDFPISKIRLPPIPSCDFHPVTVTSGLYSLYKARLLHISWFLFFLIWLVFNMACMYISSCICMHILVSQCLYRVSLSSLVITNQWKT